MLPTSVVGSFNAEKLQSLINDNPIKYVNTSRYTYGTAGFRMNADYLHSVVIRVGMLAVLRSLSRECVEYVSNKELGSTMRVHEAVGVMITASHNPARDNGVKVIDPNGGMLDRTWEDDAEQLVNAAENNVLELYQAIMKKRTLSSEFRPLVFIGYDTRISSPLQASQVEQTCLCLGAVVVQYGYLTTPQLHFHVGHGNQMRALSSKEDYHNTLVGSFQSFFKEFCLETKSGDLDLHIDCANGIGAQAVLEAQKQFPELLQLPFTWTLVNNPFQTGSSESRDLLVELDRNVEVNKDCGADVIKGLRWPALFPKSGLTNGNYASFDGDCDRLVLFKEAADGSPKLIDGDRIGVYVLACFQNLLNAAQIQGSIGYVGSQYTNGAAVRFARDLGVDVELALTGVKHLHAKAVLFDIGVYFESNGHGTALFSSSLMKRLQEPSSDAVVQSARRKQLLLAGIVNPFIGDAFADLLLLLALLADRGESPKTLLELYFDAPCALTKASVLDTTRIRTAIDNEALCIAPAGLQDALGNIVAQFGPTARAFVRPSGTEPVVRIYAEADSLNNALLLNKQVADLVTRFMLA